MGRRAAGGARGASAGHRVVAAVLVATTVVAGCTDDPPQDEASPSAMPTTPSATETGAPGDRVLVIGAPATMAAPAESAALVQAASRLAEDLPEGVAEVRGVVAASEAFARDLAEFGVDDGYDLVCVVGVGAAPLLLDLARARRDGRFCGTDPAVAGGPVNLVAAGVDPAALVRAGAAAIGTAPSPVGLLLTTPVGDVDRLSDLFGSAVPAPTPTPSPPAPTTSPTSPATPASPGASPSPTPAGPRVITVTAGGAPPAQLAAAQDLAGRAPSRSLLLVTPGGTDAAAAAAAATELVVLSAWTVDSEGELPPNVLVALTVQWDALLAAAIEAGRDEDAPQVTLLAGDDEVLDAVPGGLPASADAAARAAAALAGETE